MKKDIPLWVASDFECKNIPLGDQQQKKLFVSKPVAVGYNKVKNLFYDTIKLKKHGYTRYNRYFGEDCV